MSEKSNLPPGAPLEPQFDGSEGNPAEANQVGPRRPPPDRRWQKGGPSPNPRGRPRNDQSMRLDVRKAFQQAINKKVSVRRGDKKVLMTRIEIGLEQLLDQFAKGDRNARRDLMEYTDKLGIDFLAEHKQTLEKAPTPNYQAILDGFLVRRSDAGDAGNVASAPRVLAPPELLDDDAAEEEATVARPPTAVTEPEPEPVPKPGVKYPKPFSRMAWTEKRAWYPEWFAEKQEQEREKQRAKEKAKAEAKEQPVAQKLDQASIGRGRPPPGGFSLTTGKWS